MEKIDKRRHYVMVLDTETANTLVFPDGKLDMSCVLMYDIGYQIMDTRGNVYLRRSFINRDIFIDERELMKSAYYAKKIPMYWEDIKAHKRKISTTYGIRKQMRQDMETYGVREVVAHHAPFDINALNVTIRYISKSRTRYWFPYGTVVWDTKRMARSVMCKMPTYKKFCTENGYLTENGQPRAGAEILYRFISKDNDFQESHTGLEDVIIEAEIMLYCMKQKKKMEKLAFRKGVNNYEYRP